MDDLHCSFCGKRKGEVKRLMSGPRVYICNECVVLCREIIGPRPPYVDRPGPERTTEDLPAQPMLLLDEDDVTAERKPPDEGHCSFCSKEKNRVTRLVAGPSVYICNECVELAEDIVAADVGPPT